MFSDRFWEIQDDGISLIMALYGYHLPNPKIERQFRNEWTPLVPLPLQKVFKPSAEVALKRIRP